MRTNVILLSVILIVLSSVSTGCSLFGGDNPTLTPTPVPTPTLTPTATPYSGPFSLTVNDTLVTGAAVPFPNGVVNVVPAPNAGSDRYTPGTVVVLTAATEQGVIATTWSGDCRGTDDSCAVTIQRETEVEIVFLRAFALFVNGVQVSGTTHTPSGGATFVVDPAPDASANRYLEGTTVTVTVAPDPAYVLKGWSGDCPTTDASCTVVMAREMRAEADITRTFGVKIDGVPVTASSHSLSGNVGTVTVRPAPVDGRYEDGQSVNLTVTLASGYRFVKWKGDCDSTGDTCRLTMDADRDVEIERVEVFRLSVNGNEVDTASLPLREATFTFAPAPNSETGRYEKDTKVRVRVEEQEGHKFVGWEGECADSRLTCDVLMTADISLKADFDSKFTLMLNDVQVTRGSHPVSGGMVTVVPPPDSSDGRFVQGTEVTLTLEKDDFAVFKGWTPDCSKPDSLMTCAVTMTDDIEVVADVKSTHTLHINDVWVDGGVVSVENGSVTVNPRPNPDTDRYEAGTLVTMTVVPDPHVVFDDTWPGSCTQTGPRCQMQITENRRVNVTLTPTYVLTVNGKAITGSSTDVDRGVVEADPAPNPSTGRYSRGKQVTLTAKPEEGAIFDGWGGDCSVSGGDCRVTMNADKDVTVTLLGTYTVMINDQHVDGTSLTLLDGSGTVAIVPVPRLAGGRYAENSVVELMITPAPERAFTGWSGDCTNPELKCTLVMDSDKKVSTSAAPTYVLHVEGKLVTDTSVDVDGGIVTVRPGPTSADGRYVSGTTVTLEAVTGEGNVFGSWGGDRPNNGVVCHLVMERAMSVSVTFAETFSITVNGVEVSGSRTALPSGVGHVVPNPSPNVPPARYSAGMSVILTIEPATDHVLQGWGGACSSATSVCALTMTEDKAVTVDVVQAFALTVNGTKVVGSPHAVSGGEVVVSQTPNASGAMYTKDTLVTLNAEATGESAFTGWGGACAGTVVDADCTVTMTGAMSVTANFGELVLLTVMVDGGGAVRVEPSSPDGRYVRDTLVTLTAEADEGNALSEWGSACSGAESALTCQLEMSTARTVTANFMPSHVLMLNGVQATLSPILPVGGQVTISPVPNAPGSRYTEGTEVRLIALADADYAFTNWGGDCSGSGESATCDIVMGEDKAVTATFVPSHALTLNGELVVGSPIVLDGGQIIVSPVPTAPGGRYAEGTDVVLVAQADADYAFLGWSGDCTGTAACQITMDADRNVSASFGQSFVLDIDGETVTGSPHDVANGQVTVSPIPNAAGNRYLKETQVTLEFVGTAGYTFTEWGGACTGESPMCDLTMDSNKSVTTTATPSYSLTVNGIQVIDPIVELTEGTVRVGVPPSAVGGLYLQGTEVTLSVTANVGYAFTAWGGDCLGAGGNATCDVIMDGDKAVTVSFTEAYVLTLDGAQVTGSPVGVGNGAVTIDPTPSAPGDRYSKDTEVTLTVTADAGNAFEVWGGDCLGAGNDCTVTMTDEMSVTTSFVETFILEVNGMLVDGTSVSVPGGTIIIGPGPNSGDGRYVFGTEVTLKAFADPDPGYGFVGWGGACMGFGTDATCDLTIDMDRSATAAFALLRTLTVEKSGSGFGSVSSSPAGIDCGSDCMEEYLDGTFVTLTAEADVESVFSGWGGDCAGFGTSPSCDLVMDDTKAATATFLSLYTLTVSKDGSGAGSVTSDPVGIDCGADCSGTYVDGTSVTLTAVPDATSIFDKWGGACAGTLPGENCVVSMDASNSVAATFVAVHGLAISVVGPGVVTSIPSGINCGLDCDKEYRHNTVVILTAMPDADTVFAGWGSDCLGFGSGVSCSLVMDTSKSVTATFIPQHELLVNVEPAEGGTVTSDPVGINCGSDCSKQYDAGTSVTLHAIPKTDWQFVGWSDECGGAASPCVLTMGGPRSVTATFVRLYDLTVTKDGTGSGVVASAPFGIDCGTDCEEKYVNDPTVVLTADPAPGSVFTGWTGSCASFGSAPCSLKMDGDKIAVATFAQQHALVVTLDGLGSGTVTSNPPGISCEADCNAAFNQGTNVVLTAVADSGMAFVGWGEACTGTEPTCSLQMNAAKSVSATFTPEYALAVTKAGTGSGTVSSDPAGIVCGSDCDEPYHHDTIVTLTATADPGSAFVEWGGACAGVASTCSVTMDEAKSVSASFTLRHTLAVTVAGSTEGAVTSTPVGIDCGADCEETFDDGESVALTATANPNAVFIEWSGDCASFDTATICDLAMDGAKSATATFKPTHAVDVTIESISVGTGEVLITPLSNAPDGRYISGTLVRLEEIPSPNSEFVEWGGDCVGTPSTNDCVLLMDGDKSVTATFVAVHGLTVSVGGAGLVTSDPAGVNCEPGCDGSYVHNTAVQITATASAGSVFVGWGADCASFGGATICDLTMDMAKSVWATFKPLYEVSVTVDPLGGGTVTSDLAGIVCPVDCSELYEADTIVLLNPTPQQGWQFVGWSGACSGTVSPCEIAMNADAAVTATFIQLFTLTVTKDGTGSGTVSSNPTGIDCGADCDEVYSDEANVTLTVATDDLNVFFGWGGACSGVASDCTVTMDAAKSVTATFNKLDDMITLDGGTLNGVSIVPATPEITVAAGTTITGTLNVTVLNTHDGGAVFPVGGTSSWGDHATSYWTISNSAPAGTTGYAVPVSLTAPTEPGTYYIIVASGAETSLGHVMSATRWYQGAAQWDNGDDVAGWSAAQIDFIIANGYLIAPSYPEPSSRFGAVAVKVHVDVSDLPTNIQDGETVAHSASLLGYYPQGMADDIWVFMQPIGGSYYPQSLNACAGEHTPEVGGQFEMRIVSGEL